jgi:molecular chaperone DnaK (HSP70)
MASVETTVTPWSIQTFVVPQVVAPGQIEARESLPSFHYQPAAGEFSPGALQLGWSTTEPTHMVGLFARDQGTLAPARLINSAKSWLCHPGVDRTAELLPWQGAADVDRLSPVTVSARYLQHFRAAWDAAHPQDPLAEQDFVLTLPASFDEVARELTVRAAQQAGLPRVVLIEEPQAAFYAWIAKHADEWERLVAPGQKILVCDVGGGTTDFTLIRVRKGPDGLVQFHRVAVGEHLILGGDNLDLALAQSLEQKLTNGGKLDPRTWSVLVRSCRGLKELLLGDNPPEQYTLALPGSGSKLIGGGLRVTVTRDEVERLILDGFFPSVPLDCQPQGARSGFQEFGLPYAADAAITRYLAAFLTAHRHAGDIEPTTTTHDPARPDLLLFNGGVFESTAIRQRLIDQLHAWFRKDDPSWSITTLANERLDLAVARGAAYYGMVRRGQGVRIAAGLARTYYVGVAAADGTTQALCLCPAGLEPGAEIDLTQREFTLPLSQPIEFPLYVSSLRLTDLPGELVALDPAQLRALPPIRTVLKSTKGQTAATVRVVLRARLTEIGTLDLWCCEVDGPRKWKLLFDVRSATQTEIAATASVAAAEGVFDDAVLEAAQQAISSVFATGTSAPGGLMKALHEIIGLDRAQWPASWLRQLWETLLQHEAGRRRSAVHEARWLNLLGFALRPGYGLAVDDWRVNETWKTLNGKLAFPTAASRIEWWILWRRVAGGLTAGQQQSLAGPLIHSLKDWSKTPGKPRSDQAGPQEIAEQCRLVGACEWLAPHLKQSLGETLLEVLARPVHESVRSAAYWAIGRLGARQPVYGPLNTVLTTEIVVRWIERIERLGGTDPMQSFAVMQLARKTDDRYRDLDDATRAGVLKWLDRIEAPKAQRRLVKEVGTLDTDDQNLVFGDALPLGLHLAPGQ